MKLRQKLAMVLASAMVVTAVPVTTMAYSTNQITGIMSAVDGQQVTLKDDLKLVFDFEDSILTKINEKTLNYLQKDLKVAYTWNTEQLGTMFYINAKDFTFNKDGYMYEVAAKYDTDALVAAINTAIKGQNINLKAVTTPATTTPGSVVATSVDVEYTDILDFLKTKEIKDTTVVVKLEVEYYTDAEGHTAKKTVSYTKADLIKLGVEPELFDAVEGVYTDTAITFDAKGEYINPAGRTTAFGGETVVEFLSKDQVRVYVADTTKTGEVKVAIPVIGTMAGKSPRLEVDPYDSASSVSSSVHYLTKEEIGSKVLSFKADDAAKITVNGGKLAGFTITENKEDALEKGTVITLDLGKYSDLQFSEKQDITLTGKGAFAPAKDVKVTAVPKENGQKLEITIPDGAQVGTTVGAWVVSGAKVEAKSLKYGAEEGAVDVTVSAKDDMFAKTTVKLGEVVEFGVSVDVKPAQLIAGRVNDGEDKDKKAKLEEAVITLTEGVNESFDDKRWAYFEMPEGINVKVADFAAVEKSVKINGDAADAGAAKFKLDTDKDGVYVKGFSIEFEYTNNTEDEGKMVVDKANVVQFTIPFCAPLGAEAGDYNLEIISKYMPELEGELKVAEVVAPVEVTFEQKDVKVGLEKQEMGNITIKETAAKMIREGELSVFLDDIKLETAKKDIVLETSEGSKMDVRVKSVVTTKEGSTIVLDIDREAKEAAAITIKGLVGTVYRTVPEGGTDIKVYGESIQDAHCITDDKDDDINTIVVEDYNAVPTKNTEDINNASKLNTVKITANATSYEVNGETKEITADLVAFNSANGRMLAPVRLVGTAFGAEFSYGTINNATVVTFFKDGKAVSFTNGSTVMNVNGVQSVMAEAATIKEGRLFVPLRDLANALGIKVNYDEATKTAEFTNAEK